MNIAEGNTFWNNNIKIKKYPYIFEEKNCDVLVIGGGLSGALTAYMQQKTGAKIIVVDKNIIGYGATVSHDGMLFGRIDELDNKQCKNVPLKTLEKCNKLLSQAMIDISNIINEVLKDEDCKKYIDNLGFKKVDMLYFSDRITNKMSMYKLFEKLGHENPNVEYLEEDPIINLKTGILIPESGISINPYVLTEIIFLYLSKKDNVEIYENTKIVGINNVEDNVQCITYNNFKINAKHCIITCGVHAYDFVKNVDFNVNKVFTMVTDVIPSLDDTYINIIAKDVLGMQISFTKDKRIILSGEVSKNIDKEINLNKFARGKYKKLYFTLNKLFNIPDITVTNCFYGNFLDTKDGLPVIDELEELPNVYCNIGCGRNGVLYSMIGANMLRDISKKYHVKDMYIFRENRERKT